MIERIHWIEQQKINGKCLNEIRELLTVEQTQIEEIDVQDIRLQMRKLEHDVAKILDQMDDQEKLKFKKRMSTESVALMQSLLLLLP